jgi:hypothetical protein
MFGAPFLQQTATGVSLGLTCEQVRALLAAVVNKHARDRTSCRTTRYRRVW